MIIVDLGKFHFGLLDDPLRTLLISASGSDVKTSIINGRVVMRDRQIQGIDLEQLQLQGQAYYDKMKLG